MTKGLVLYYSAYGHVGDHRGAGARAPGADGVRRNGQWMVQ